MRHLARILLAVALLAVTALPGHAKERILQFDSNIFVHSDGSLRVKETIRVRAERRAIRRGIYRDFPIKYRNQSGTWRRVGFKIVSVLRDGHPEPYFTKPSGSYRRLYIGEKNTWLKAGEYTYEIVYDTTRQLRYFKDFDELYWNVTGTKWQFPIDRATATITLPEGATILQHNAFTGRFGQAGRDYDVTELIDRKISFETTRALGSFEGLTVAVGWQKGIVPVPSRLADLGWFVWDNLGLIILALGTLGTMAYFFSTWARIGRDPEGGVIIPLFSPPKGLSAAAVSYIHYRKFKGKGSGASLAFIAALVSLAIKKKLVIKKPGETLTLERLERSTAGLPKGEAKILSGLLGSRKSIRFETSTASTVQLTRSNFKSAIDDEHGEIYFKNNRLYFFAGAVLGIVVLLAYMFLYPADDEEIFMSLAACVSAAAGSLLLAMGLRRLWDKIPGGGSAIVGSFLTVAGVLALVPVIVIVLAPGGMPHWVPAALGMIASMNVIFFNLLHAPTELGRQVMDEIEGFKLYLSVAEADRMNMQGAPAVTPAVFEKFLPYAIAMGVEKPWSKALEAQLARAGETDTAYHATWYNGGRGWSTSDLGAATAGIVGGVSAGMAAATPPSSSGSSGGGGFSGGGGGGGGGGGW